MRKLLQKLRNRLRNLFPVHHSGYTYYEWSDKTYTIEANYYRWLIPCLYWEEFSIPLPPRFKTKNEAHAYVAAMVKRRKPPVKRFMTTVNKFNEQRFYG